MKDENIVLLSCLEEIQESVIETEFETLLAINEEFKKNSNDYRIR